MWDQILVYLIVACAAAYLALRYLRKKPGCGGCDRGCGSGATPPAQREDEGELIQLEVRPHRPSRKAKP